MKGSSVRKNFAKEIESNCFVGCTWREKGLELSCDSWDAFKGPWDKQKPLGEKPTVRGSESFQTVNLSGPSIAGTRELRRGPLSEWTAYFSVILGAQWRSKVEQRPGVLNVQQATEWISWRRQAWTRNRKLLHQSALSCIHYFGLNVSTNAHVEI